MTSLLLIGRIVLSAVFGVAGVAKLVDRAGSRKSLTEFGVPELVAPTVAWLLPAMELSFAVALLRSSWAAWGAIGALLLLGMFVAGIANSMMRGRRPACRCFGQLHSSPAGWTTLVRNMVLAGLAALIVWQGPGASVIAAVTAPSYLASGSSRTHLVLEVVVAGQAVFALVLLYHLLRQNGRMLLRIDALEARLGIAADQPVPAASGLPIGSTAPAFSLESLNGGAVTLDALQLGGRPVVLFFTDAACSPCTAALPEVARWQREHAGHVVIVPIARGGAEANRAKARENGVQNVLLQIGSEVADAYRAGGTPSAVLVAGGQIASPVAGGVDAIRDLVAKAALPPPLKKGDIVPSIAVRDLNGGTMDLASLKGRRTLLLFWNPACGFCEAMLEDLKTWERNRHRDALQLIVVSAGSPAANRAQGFRSRVLLDPKFDVGQLFGADGTPSAIVVDEDGRVASSVCVGAPAVLALAGGARVESPVPA